jgi:hypothetical protein
VRVPQVTFETVWDTSKFNSLWPSGAANPFVWSFEGSPTGYGTHADYMFGWKGDSLQKAMDKSECFYDGCGSIKKQQMSVANQCTVKDFVGEQTDGCKFEDWGVQFCVMVLTYDRAEAVAGYGDGVGGDGVVGDVGLCEGTFVFLPRSFLLSRATSCLYLDFTSWILFQFICSVAPNLRCIIMLSDKCNWRSVQ